MPPRSRPQSSVASTAWRNRQFSVCLAPSIAILGPVASRRVFSNATGIMVSNHGGRQLDSAPAPIDCLPAIRDAIGNDVEVILDGGIRRGSHILKALALGASACSIGRPYLYGLAAGGEAGVAKTIEILASETRRSMLLAGYDSVASLIAGSPVRRHA